MAAPSTSWQEVSTNPERLAALHNLDILDSPREPAFDRISELIRLAFGVEIGLVTLIDAHRQWYKAAIGMTETEQALDSAFCRFTLEEGGPVIVNDATQDPRFSDHEKVVGDPRIRFYAGAPITTAKGLIIGSICAIDTQKRDFGAREVAILEHLAGLVMHGLELRQEAVTDVLTGASSRRSFKQEAGKHIALAHRNDFALSCVTIDIDHFKSVNDTYGHPAGDQVLSGVANALRVNLRQSDIIGRLGGEEFAILLPQTDAATAVGVAEKLRQVINALRFPVSSPPLAITASIGVASVVKGDDIDSLLARSDQALYTAKRAGRDRVCVEKSDAATEKTNKRRVLRAGTIFFNEGRASYNCTIRSVWDEGAEATLGLTTSVPDNFELAISGSSKRYHCRLIKRSTTTVELEYV